MKLTKITILIGFLFIFLQACEENNEVIYETDAMLIWTGSYDVDGCGFFVEIDSVEYKPENEGIIPPEYKTVQPLNITVQYIDLLYDMEYNCGDLPEAQKTNAIKLVYMALNEDIP